MRRYIAIICPYDIIVNHNIPFSEITINEVFEIKHGNIRAAENDVSTMSYLIYIEHEALPEVSLGSTCMRYCLSDARNKFPYLFTDTNPLLYQQFKPIDPHWKSRISIMSNMREYAKLVGYESAAGLYLKDWSTLKSIGMLQRERIGTVKEKLGDDVYLISDADAREADVVELYTFDDDRQYKLNWIDKYLVHEEFKHVHLDALIDIISLFNDNEQASKDIFNFVKKLNNRHRPVLPIGPLYCDDCEHLSLTEEAQRQQYRIRGKFFDRHQCLKYKWTLSHEMKHPNLPRPEECDSYTPSSIAQDVPDKNQFYSGY